MRWGRGCQSKPTLPVTTAPCHTVPYVDTSGAAWTASQWSGTETKALRKGWSLKGKGSKSKRRRQDGGRRTVDEGRWARDTAGLQRAVLRRTGRACVRRSSTGDRLLLPVMPRSVLCVSTIAKEPDKRLHRGLRVEWRGPPEVLRPVQRAYALSDGQPRLWSCRLHHARELLRESGESG